MGRNNTVMESLSARRKNTGKERKVNGEGRIQWRIRRKKSY